jgi:hypothetical protein
LGEFAGNSIVSQGDIIMPLPMKTLREASSALGIPEAEIRALVDLGKVRAVLKKGVPTFAPDEIAKMIRQRKTLPESQKK